jgi:hypothetical protein
MRRGIAGVRLCDTPGCPGRWPCGVHGTLTVAGESGGPFNAWEVVQDGVVTRDYFVCASCGRHSCFCRREQAAPSTSVPVAKRFTRHAAECKHDGVREARNGHAYCCQCGALMPALDLLAVPTSWHEWPRFPIGARVRCIDASHTRNLTLGQEYVVTETREDGMGMRVEGANGLGRTWWRSVRFELVAEKPKAKREWRADIGNHLSLLDESGEAFALVYLTGANPLWLLWVRGSAPNSFVMLGQYTFQATAMFEAERELDEQEARA